MRTTESARKIASLTAIALVITASCLLWHATPSPLLPAAPLPAILLVQHPFQVEPALGVRPGPDQGQIRVRPRSDRGQIGVRPGSEYEYAATQPSGTSASQELRTLLAARSLPVDVVAPSVVPDAIVAAGPPGSVSRALHAAGRETGDAFRTASRIVRSLF